MSPPASNGTDTRQTPNDKQTPVNTSTPPVNQQNPDVKQSPVTTPPVNQQNPDVKQTPVNTTTPPVNQQTADVKQTPVTIPPVNQQTPDDNPTPVETPTIELPEEQLAELEVIFDKFDVEGDAQPLSEELENMVRLMGYDPDWKELRFLQSKLRGMDHMRFEQFVKIMVEEEKRREEKRGFGENEILAIFKSWDPDNTGFISRETFVSNMTTKGDPLEENEMELMLNEMIEDETADYPDVIEYEPFVRRMFEMLTKAKEQRTMEVEKLLKEKRKRANKEELSNESEPVTVPSSIEKAIGNQDET